MGLKKFIKQNSPWGLQSMRFLDYFFLRNINKILLKFKFLPKYINEDITVVLAVKNRYDHRIKNAFYSIRNQDYPLDLVKIMLVDYCSKKELIPKYTNLCTHYDAEYIRVNNKLQWNRSHALNIGIKKAKSKYILSTDTDIIFEPNYITVAIKELQRNPYQVILARCLDAPKIVIDIKDYFELKKICNYRFEKIYLSKGINITLGHFYHKIRGYDETYIEWGLEDTDLMKRFKLFGLKKKDVSLQTSYIHQWHPKYWGASNHDQINKNRIYFETNHSIIRNKNGWGKI